VAMQEHDCWSLWNRTIYNPPNQIRIAEAGGISVVMLAMTAHIGNMKKQEWCFGALRNLACDNADIQIVIAAAGGIKMVVSVMRLHPREEGVQVQGCGALVNPGVNADNRILIAAAGVISVVVATMKAHISSSDVQQQGCWALSNLAFKNDTNQALILSEGAISVIVLAMKAHTGHLGVQERGGLALKFLVAIVEKQNTLETASSSLPRFAAMMTCLGMWACKTWVANKARAEQKQFLSFSKNFKERTQN